MKEWNERKLDKELETLAGAMPDQNELEKKIEKCINRKIRKTVLRTIAAITAIVLLLALIINPLMNAYYLNPYELHKGESSVLLSVLRDYWETMQPYTEITSVDVEKKGFAEYELSMQVYNQIDHLTVGERNVKCEVKRGKYEDIEDSNAYLTHVMGRFACEWNEKGEVIEDLKELPASSVIYLSIGLESPKSVDSLMRENMELNWIEIYQPNVEFQGGLSLVMSANINEDDVRREMSGEKLKKVYLSNLENLLKNQEVWKSLGIKSGSTVYLDHMVLKDTYEDAKEIEILQTKNFCISGKRDEIVAYLEKEEVNSILVDEVKLTDLQ